MKIRQEMLIDRLLAMNSFYLSGHPNERLMASAIQIQQYNFLREQVEKDMCDECKDLLPPKLDDNVDDRKYFNWGEVRQFTGELLAVAQCAFGLKPQPIFFTANQARTSPCSATWTTNEGCCQNQKDEDDDNDAAATAAE